VSDYNPTRTLHAAHEERHIHTGILFIRTVLENFHLFYGSAGTIPTLQEGYSLQPNFSQNFSKTNDSSVENIWTQPSDGTTYKAIILAHILAFSTGQMGNAIRQLIHNKLIDLASRRLIHIRHQRYDKEYLECAIYDYR